jgi:hypothetical protein
MQGFNCSGRIYDIGQVFLRQNLSTFIRRRYYLCPKKYNMRYSASCLFIAILLISLFGCTKNKGDDGPGKGGNANLTIYPQHHQVAKNLRNMVVYIKYNASSPPSNGVYDDSVTCTRNDSLSVAMFNGLKNGNYYIYGHGSDTSIFQNVKAASRIPYRNRLTRTFTCL